MPKEQERWGAGGMMKPVGRSRDMETCSFILKAMSNMSYETRNP